MGWIYSSPLFFQGKSEIERIMQGLLGAAFQNQVPQLTRIVVFW